MFGRIRKFVEDADDTYQSAPLPLGINPTTQNHSLNSQPSNSPRKSSLNSSNKKITN
jgi:hypothetical protein